MPLVGSPIQPRVIAKSCHEAGWRDEDLIIAVAVALSESNGYPLAYHDNLDVTGNVLTRDVGLFEINIAGSAIGTAYEKDLYDVSTNVAHAKMMFDNRGWEPWYGYTNGYATSPDWWRWSKTSQSWVRTGMYLHRAIRGVADYHAEKMGISPVPLLYFTTIVPPKPSEPPA